MDALALLELLLGFLQLANLIRQLGAQISIGLKVSRENRKWLQHWEESKKKDLSLELSDTFNETIIKFRRGDM